ncbi:unnamed protein product [Bursaphelenchus xylophilus]|uniref:(pine wood nematode) hypothetical protein n=1 Tax=Bursaphelenchus xylophilus TaxID=6326 RepID=A0A1I7SR28_BURXY|nr:unnamed protein product [Bursaphelenchus xylophilus]CAG9110744.1 unnamed protein product [Bursaphelenchus xylophilus]
MSEKLTFTDIFCPAYQVKQTPTYHNYDIVYGEPDPVDRVLPSEGASCSQILENICTREYGERPVFEEEDTEKTKVVNGVEMPVPYFKRTFVFLGLRGHGEGFSINIATQMAAKETLLKIIDAGWHTKYRMAGKTKDEAKEWVRKLYEKVSETDKPSTEAKQNWIGDIITLCQRKKLPKVSYSEESTGPDHEKRFIVTARCDELNLVVKSDPMAKKTAKNHAAERMYGQLEKWIQDHPKPDESNSSSGNTST